MNNINNIELANTIDGILNNPPSWIVKVGSSFVLGIVILITIMFTMIKYPDIIEIPITAKNIDNNNITIIIPCSKPFIDITNKTKTEIIINDNAGNEFYRIKANIISIRYNTKINKIKIEAMSRDKTFILYSSLKSECSNIYLSFTINNKTLIKRFFNTFKINTYSNKKIKSEKL